MQYIDQYGNVFTDMRFVRSKYVDNGRPYVEAWCKEEGNDYYECYADVTVNLFAPLTAIDGYHVHVDTNNVPRLVDWMCEQGFMTKTGKVAQSGFCEYPEVELNHEWYDGLESYE